MKQETKENMALLVNMLWAIDELCKAQKKDNNHYWIVAEEALTDAEIAIKNLIWAAHVDTL